MRYAVLKSANNWIALPKSTKYEELPKDESLFDYIRDLPHIGMLLGLKADFYVVGPYDKPDLEDYDVIIKLDTVPYIRTKDVGDALLCYQAPEPFLKVFNPDIAHCLLDNFITEFDEVHLPDYHIPWTYRYPIKLMRTHLQPKLNPSHVFVQKRTILLDEPEHARGEAMGIRPYRSYLRYMSECRYLFNLDGNESAGQISAEAAIMDVLSFGNPIKPLQRLLFPDVCDAAHETELWFLYEEFEKDENLYYGALDVVRDNLKHIDCKGLDHIFEERVLSKFE